MKRPLLSLFFLTILGIFCLYPREYQPDPVFPQGRSYPVTVHGELKTFSQGENTSSLTLSHCRIQYQGQTYHCRQLLVSVTEDISRLRAGNFLSVEGSLSSFQPARNPGNFDWRDYYLARHISYQIYADRVTITDSQTATLRQFVLHLRQYLKDGIRHACGEDANTAALLTALLLGDKSDLSEETSEKYQTGGILHILTVSGLHISLLGGAVLTLGETSGLPLWLRSLLSTLLIYLYWQLCGAATSPGRAAIMFVCMILAPLLGRSYDSLSALSLAGLLILWDSPRMLFQAGFQLSFAAVLGIQLICPVFVPPPSQSDSFLYRSMSSLRSSLLFSLGLQMTLLPVTLYHFFRYPLYSLLLNLLVLPLTAPLFLLGSGAMLVTATFPLHGLIPAQCLLLPCRWILSLYDLLCSVVLPLPGSSALLGRPAPLRIGLYYCGLLLFCLIRYKTKNLKKNTASSQIQSSQVNAQTHRRHSPRNPRLLRFLFPLCPVILVMFLLLPTPRHSLSVVFLDVGQGDCAFLETPSGTTILIDCGSSDIKQVAHYRLVPFLEARGIDHLDYVFLSHTDEDHVNGVTAWLEEGRSIGTVILPALSDTLASDASYQNILRYFQDRQIPVLFFHQGMSWQEGPLTLTCLAPFSPTTDNTLLYPDHNTASLVLLAQYQGIRILFTGDCEKEGEQLLLSHLTAERITCHILKAGHHGSAYATSEEFLSQLSPQAVIVSCGIRNRYGHPHPVTLERIQQQRSSCYVTASCGAVIVTIQKGNARIKTFLPPGEIYYR